MKRVVVSDARGAAAADRAAIAGRIPSRALMQRAGAAVAAEIATRFASDLHRGVVIATGSGNNGGDGWVIARALHAAGIAVRVVECAPASTDDARAERALTLADGVKVESNATALLTGGEVIAVDALLGTGFNADTPLREPLQRAVANLETLQARGATVVALDVPSGLDASTGKSQGKLNATITFTFGTCKEGLLRARSRSGGIVVIDIGLGVHADCAGIAVLAQPQWFAESLPRISADAHKGTRKKLAIIGGAGGMAGAALLASRAALQSGVGLVKCIVADESLLALQQGEPAALAHAWPRTREEWSRELADWADAVLIGPGLGRENARSMVETVLGVFSGPVVLDADALNAFAGDAASLGPLLAGRPALLTPHPLEFNRLAGKAHDAVASHEDQLGIARETGATVLLKGVPTVLVSPDGATTFVAEGTPILATGGSGDVLGGIAATLLAQTGDAMRAGSLAAFAHGRAAASLAKQVRGFTIEDVIAALRDVWTLVPPQPRPPILVELPAVPDMR